VLRDITALAPDDETATLLLAEIYARTGRAQDAPHLWRKAMADDADYQPKKFTISAADEDSGPDQDPEKQPPWPGAVTAANYRAMREMIISRKAIFVAMQYPRLPISALERILGDRPGVVYASNQENFERALKAGSYQDYFTDRFAKTWGHCTAKGNRLIAENLVRVIWQALHGRKGSAEVTQGPGKFGAGKT
jgi:hypothetical protein